MCALGHSHPEIASAVARQAQTLVHASNLFGHEPAGTLAAELARRSGFERVFFCNSGTEANEAAIKLARKFAFRRGEADRAAIVSCTGSFHGRTLGALAATANAAYHEGFGPLPGAFRTTPFNDAAALERAIDDTVAAFIVEPVQGESGVNVASHAFLGAAREVCSRRGALLIFDEIQCGMGRVGPLFAFQRFGIRPDALTLAKALANGLPIGAMLVELPYAGALRPGDHGATFGGSPIPCAAARLFDGLTRVAERHPPIFAEPRGLGLLAALPVRSPFDAADIVAYARDDAHVLVNKAGGNTIRLAPPLVVSPPQVERIVRALDFSAKMLS